MFAKIFSSIFDSSIADDWQTRVVFQDMLVLADKDGIMDMTIAAFARRTNTPLEMIQRAIPILEAPDPSSRTPDKNGARIVRMDAHRDWGWKIVNYTKYRESATKEMLRMAEADRKRAYRERQRKFPSPRPPTLQEAEGDADKSMDMSRTFNHHKTGLEPPQPLPSLLPKLIRTIKAEIAKTPETETQKQNELWNKLSKYEVQLYGHTLSERKPKPAQSQVTDRKQTIFVTMTPEQRAGLGRKLREAAS